MAPSRPARHYGIDYGINTIMKPKRIKKVTMELPESLVKEALEETRQSLTETVRQGLEILVARKAGRALAEAGGRVDLKLDVADLRRDRKP